MNPFIKIATEAARAAGRVAVKGFERPDLIKATPKVGKDFVTNLDHEAEAAAIDVIHHVYPQHAILGEETGVLGDNAIVWIIDPIDGTKNLIHTVPHIAVCIAVQIDGRIEHGVIYDPLRDELYSASAGRGAQLNDRRIRASSRALEESLVGVSYPILSAEDTLDSAKKMALLSATCGSVRRMGSAALDLAYVAAGRLDACLGTHLKIWDYAAGVLIAKEAGCLVSDWAGGEDCDRDGQLLVASPKLHKPLLKLIS